MPTSSTSAAPSEDSDKTVTQQTYTAFTQPSTTAAPLIPSSLQPSPSPTDPNISVRDHIQWHAELPQEPTSTLVLTTPHRFYIDLRIFLPSPSLLLHEPTLPNTGGPLSRLEWAFAGTSSSVPTLSPSGTPITHSVWHHWVDSGQIPISIGEGERETDEGDMYTQPDGRTLELGAMRHPVSGVVTPYQELWHDVPIQTCGDEGAKYAVVIAIDEPEKGVRGMVVRVGQWCQGMMVSRDEVAVERWEYIPQGEEGGRGGKEEAVRAGEEVVSDGDWTRWVRIGRLFLPCAVAFKSPATLREGNVVVHKGSTWVVREVHSFL